MAINVEGHVDMQDAPGMLRGWIRLSLGFQVQKEAILESHLALGVRLASHCPNQDDFFKLGLGGEPPKQGLGTGLRAWHGGLAATMGVRLELGKVLWPHGSVCCESRWDFIFHMPVFEAFES